MYRQSYSIWITAVFCGGIVFGALALITHMTLGLENRIYVEGEKQSRVRDAMWAMDSYAESLIARENARPAEDFSGYNSVFNESKEKGKLSFSNRRSPLIEGVPEDVHYYWYYKVPEKYTDFQLQSPSVPNDEVGKITTGRAISQSNEVVQNHNTLSEFLKDENAGAKGEQVSNFYRVSELAKNAQSESFGYSKEVLSEIDLQLADAVNKQSESWYGVKKQSDDGEQRALLDKRMRQSSKLKVSAKKASKPHKQKGQKEQSPAALLEFNQAPNDVQAPNLVETEGLHLQFDGAKVSPYVALLMEGEFFLVRLVSTAVGDYVQGVWINGAKLKSELLSQARVYLPNAELVNIEADIDVDSLNYGEDDPYVIGALPLALVPGDIPNVLHGVTPMRLNLIIVWGCVLLATAAVCMMFRGVMKLSERRASFVSSVSHELRTPLTTFKLYSDLLSEGMVKDEKKRSKYLEVLSQESDRLIHMVENVLHLSQLENGKRKKQLDDIALDDMLEVVERGFVSKLNQEAVEYESIIPDDLKKVIIKGDMTSIDQIITNLVDNSLKYGRSEEGSKIWLEARELGKYLIIEFSDNGRGLSADNKLFTPFHKSDVEAAHSKPGVGLGLALSRKLARAMGGELSALPSDSGARFELKLEMAK